jgi:hypothetical protein
VKKQEDYPYDPLRRKRKKTSAFWAALPGLFYFFYKWSKPEEKERKVKVIKKHALSISDLPALNQFNKSEYKNYKYGDPRTAADDLLSLIVDFHSQANKILSSALEKTGPYLAPAMQQAFLKDLQRAVNALSIVKGPATPRVPEGTDVSKMEREDLKNLWPTGSKRKTLKRRSVSGE